MSDRICVVPKCPALARPDKTTCGIHAYARLAEGLWYQGIPMRDLTCANCERVLRKDHWVYDEPNEPPRHVACDPARPRTTLQQLRESPKPLLDLA